MTRVERLAAIRQHLALANDGEWTQVAANAIADMVERDEATGVRPWFKFYRSRGREANALPELIAAKFPVEYAGDVDWLLGEVKRLREALANAKLPVATITGGPHFVMSQELAAVLAHNAAIAAALEGE